MSKPKFNISVITLVFISLLSGLSGGFFCLWLSSPAKANASSSRALLAGELRLTDEEGRTRLLLTLLRGKPRLLMLDNAGEYRLEMGLGDQGEPHIWLRDQGGAAKIQVALNINGLPGFRLADAQGRERAIIGLSENGAPTMIFKGEEGKDRLALWSDKNENGLVLANSQGRAIGVFSAIEGEKARLSFFDSDGQVYNTMD